MYDQTDGTNGIDLLESMTKKYTDADLMLAGDFNAICGNLQDILYDDNVDYISDQDSVYEADKFQIIRNS